jgi:hypothetical protein
MKRLALFPYGCARSSSLNYESPDPVNGSVEFGLVNVLAFFTFDAIPTVRQYVRR